MKASISFPEIQSILLEKAQQNISFAHVDEKTIRVTYPLNLGILKKDISADLTLLDLEGSNMLVGVDAGMGTDTALGSILGLLHNKIPEGLIEKLPDRQLALHLDKIEQLKAVFDAIEVEDVHVLKEGIEVEGGLK